MTDSVDEMALPTFAVLARFQERAASGEEATRTLVERMTRSEQPFHEVRVERQDSAGCWLVLVRFVIVSIDAHTAVFGLSETLTVAGMVPDEVWVDGQVS